MLYKDCSKISMPHLVGETRQFLTIVSLDINALGPMILEHCEPTMEEGGILVFQNLFHSTYSLIIVSKMATILVEFEFRKQQEIRCSYVW